VKRADIGTLKRAITDQSVDRSNPFAVNNYMNCTCAGVFRLVIVYGFLMYQSVQSCRALGPAINSS